MAPSTTQIILDELRAHRAESRDDHEKIENRLRSLEDDKTRRDAASAERHGLARMGKAGVAILVSIASALLSVMGAMGHQPPPTH